MKSQSWNRKREKFEATIKKTYGLLIGQCTPALVKEIKDEKGYKVASTSADALWLIKALHQITGGVAKVCIIFYERLVTTVVSRIDCTATSVV